MRSLTFNVRGVPIPKGSLQPFLQKRRDGTVVARARHDNPKTVGWQSLVRGQAQTLYEPPFDGAVAVAILFRLPRPKSYPKRVVHCVTKPDVDKLARLVLDGLAGVLFARDQAVVELHARKVYAPADVGPGAVITVREAAAPDPRSNTLFDEGA